MRKYLPIADGIFREMRDELVDMYKRQRKYKAVGLDPNDSKNILLIHDDNEVIQVKLGVRIVEILETEAENGDTES